MSFQALPFEIPPYAEKLPAAGFVYEERRGLLVRDRKRAIKEKTEAEKEKLREMTREKAAEYIWTYYKIPIVSVIVLIFLAVYFIHAFLNRPGDTFLHVTFVNCYDDVSENSDFYQAFLEYAGSRKAEEVYFDANVFFDLSRESDYANSYFQKTVAYLEAGTTDAVVCQESNLAGLAKGGRILTLEDERAKPIYEKYKDRIVDYTTDEGETLPVGVDISDSRFIRDMNSYEESCYLCVSAYIGQTDHVEVFLDYLFQ